VGGGEVLLLVSRAESEPEPFPASAPRVGTQWASTAAGTGAVPAPVAAPKQLTKTVTVDALRSSQFCRQ